MEGLPAIVYRLIFGMVETNEFLKNITSGHFGEIPRRSLELKQSYARMLLIIRLWLQNTNKGLF